MIASRYSIARVIARMLRESPNYYEKSYEIFWVQSISEIDCIVSCNLWYAMGRKFFLIYRMVAMIKDFEIIPHTADLKIRVYGKTLEELFTHALIGMFQATRPIAPECRYDEHERLVCPRLPITRDIGVNSPDIESLLVDFLSDALYLSDVHNEAYLKVIIDSLSNNRMIARVQGVGINGFDESEIKAVTYHDLKIIQKDGVWQTDIVFDI
jgi:SHS2 domain-containing protein